MTACRNATSPAAWNRPARRPDFYAFAREVPLPLSEKALFRALADHAEHETGGCFPSCSILALESGLSERSVGRVMRRLKEQGLVVTLYGDDGCVLRTRIAHHTGGRYCAPPPTATFQRTSSSGVGWLR